MNEEVKVSDESASLPATNNWEGKHVYLMAIVCLLLGVVVGYLLQGSSSQPAVANNAPEVAGQQDAAANQVPTREQMKQMADTTAAPVLEKIKKDPGNFAALNDAGNVYRATHQFKEAASYYERALKINPKNAATRTDLASCLYYTGDVDGALAQLDKALSYDPKFFGALLNKGMIELHARNDAASAVSSWEKILKTSKDPQQKQIAKKLIADVSRRSAPAGGEPQRGEAN